MKEYLLIWVSYTDFFGSMTTNIRYFTTLEAAKEYRRKWSGHSNGIIYEAELVEE